MIFQKIGPLLLTIIGVLITLMGAVLFAKSRSFLKSSVEAMGTVVGFETKLNKNRQELFSPSFTFSDDKGKTLTVQSKSFHRPASYDIGQQVEVLYEKGNPTNARIKDFQSFWRSPLFVLGCGLFVTLLGLYFLFRK